MGDTRSHIERQVGRRLQAGRICIDLCENIHLHYRDLRLEFGRGEWQRFAQFVDQADRWLKTEHNDYVEDPAFFAALNDSVAPSSDYHAGRLRIEVLHNGVWHLHWHDLRIEMDREALTQLFRAFMDAQELMHICDMADALPAAANDGQRRVAMSDLRVIVLEDDGVWRPKLIEESPNYLALAQMNRQIHDAYVALQRAHHPELTDITTTEEFLKTWRNVLRHGFAFDHGDPITIDQRNVVRDGHHRVAMLLHMHGDIPLLVRDGQVIGGAA